MASSPDDPDWSALPHDPVTFFALQPGYDRTALRRAYNGFLKRFKPERFPQEFQRMRAAYDALEQFLRYTATPPGPSASRPIPPMPVARGRDTPAAEPAPAPARPGHPQPPVRPAQRPFHERLAHASVPELIAELMRTEPKSPEDYFRLAVLRDSLPDAEPLCFLKIVLAGLKRHPGDAALSRLVHEALRTDLPVEDLSRVLHALAGFVPGDGYHQLTEPGWDQLLAKTTFKQFARHLRLCESTRTIRRSPGRTVFYLHIVRKALFKADAAWLEQAWAMVEEGDDVFARHLEEDIGFVREALAYRRCSAALQATETGRALDRVIRSSCESDEPAAQCHFLDFMMRVARDPERVLADLPDSSSEPLEAAWGAFLWIQRDMAAKLGVSLVGREITAADDRSMTRWLRLVHQQFDAGMSAVRRGFMALLGTTARNEVSASICLFCAAVVMARAQHFGAGFATLVCMSAALMHFDRFWLTPTINTMLTRDRTETEDRMWHCYALAWRSGAARFCGSHRLPLPALRSLMERCAAPDDGIAAFLVRRFAEDRALDLCACAPFFEP